jgi:hypothetical protein
MPQVGFQPPISVLERAKTFHASDPAAINCVEESKNTRTSTVIPTSRRRRQKVNQVVSGETVPANLRQG